MTTDTSLAIYWKRLDSFPQDLRDLFMQFWDYTGRPTVAYPKNDMILALLAKNSALGGQSFLKDMQLVFQDMTEEESAIYYNVYIAGSKYIADRMQESLKR